VLGQAFWGTGLFLRGARRIVDFVFAHMGIMRLDARSVLQNGRGNGALRKVAAVRLGVLPQSFERAGVRLDQARWTIQRDEWWTALADWRAPIIERACGRRTGRSASQRRVGRRHRNGRWQFRKGSGTHRDQPLRCVRRGSSTTDSTSRFGAGGQTRPE